MHDIGLEMKGSQYPPFLGHPNTGLAAPKPSEKPHTNGQTIETLNGDDTRQAFFGKKIDNILHVNAGPDALVNKFPEPVGFDLLKAKPKTKKKPSYTGPTEPALSTENGATMKTRESLPDRLVQKPRKKGRSISTKSSGTKKRAKQGKIATSKDNDSAFQSVLQPSASVPEGVTKSTGGGLTTSGSQWHDGLPPRQPKSSQGKRERSKGSPKEEINIEFSMDKVKGASETHEGNGNTIDYFKERLQVLENDGDIKHAFKKKKKKKELKVTLSNQRVKNPFAESPKERHLSHKNHSTGHVKKSKSREKKPEVDEREMSPHDIKQLYGESGKKGVIKKSGKRLQHENQLKKMTRMKFFYDILTRSKENKRIDQLINENLKKNRGKFG
jgi:hypothetical protein